GHLLDGLVRDLLRGELHDAGDVDAGQVDIVRIDLTDLDELFDLRDGRLRGHRSGRIEVAGGGVEDEVAGTVALRGADQREVRWEGFLEYVVVLFAERRQRLRLLLRGLLHDVAAAVVLPGDPAVGHLGART